MKVLLEKMINFLNSVIYRKSLLAEKSNLDQVLCDYSHEDDSQCPSECPQCEYEETVGRIANEGYIAGCKHEPARNNPYKEWDYSWQFEIWEEQRVEGLLSMH